MPSHVGRTQRCCTGTRLLSIPFNLFGDQRIDQGREKSVTGSSRFVVNDPAVAGIHATVLAALVSRIRVR